MPERNPQKEVFGRGELLYLSHPGSERVFAGYGLTVQPHYPQFLVGLLMVDRPHPVNQQWLKEVEGAFGEYQLVAMTATGERGIVCQMQIEPSSLSYLSRFPSAKSEAIKTVLTPLLRHPPAPCFTLHWDDEAQSWKSQIAVSNALPPEIKDVFTQTGYGCLAVESNRGVVHVCHAPSRDIKGFIGKPIRCQWQLIKMPTAPLVRLEMTVIDNPFQPYKLESFLNVAADDQARILAQLANQDHLLLAFYGDNLEYELSLTVTHGEQQWQQLDELMAQALRYWRTLPQKVRDFDKAKAEFLRYAP